MMVVIVVIVYYTKQKQCIACCEKTNLGQEVVERTQELSIELTEVGGESDESEGEDEI